MFTVRAGDVVHLYWVDHGTATSIGSFEVISPSQHPAPRRFAVVLNSALVRVMDPAFHDEIASMGTYHVDPNIKLFTGWPVRATAKEPPAYDAANFARQGAIARWS